jgi:hypothetical protein
MIHENIIQKHSYGSFTLTKFASKKANDRISSISYKTFYGRKLRSVLINSETQASFI